MSGAARRLLWMAAMVLGLHVAGAGLLALALAGPVSAATALGVGTGVTAYTLGLRHAFDADHIAAIDNVTRRLRGDGHPSSAVGLAFSLGHSSVVLLLTVSLALGGGLLVDQLSSDGSVLHEITGTLGPLVSGLFLLGIGALNVVALRSTVRALRAVRRGERSVDAAGPRGPLLRLLARPIAAVDRGWKMYPLGFLFGLGFDTATEVGLLVLAGSGVAAQLPLWAVLSLPLLFAAGMSLMDTLNGVVMDAAFGWSTGDRIRRLRYDVTITSLSVAVAVGVGVVELAGTLGGQVDALPDLVRDVGAADVAAAGYALAALSLAVWGVAALAARRARYQRTSAWDRSEA
ncbi:MAG: HoxN/HupN/NixA family nickel/cobalt transporter [Thermoleophilia bacterium]